METLHRDTARTYRQSDDTATLTGRQQRRRSSAREGVSDAAR